MLPIICDDVEENSNKIWWNLHKNWERLKTNKKFGTLEKLRMKWSKIAMSNGKVFWNLKFKKIQ
jgi:hypothetical protein